MSLSSDGSLQILLVEDNPGDARLFQHHLETAQSEAFPTPEVTHVEALSPALEQLESDAYDLVLLDLGLPESNGLDTLDRYLDAQDRDEIDPTPVVVLTGLKDDQTSIEAIERGAQDYLVKDEIESNLLNRTIRYALERHRQQQKLRRQNRRLEEFAGVVSHDLRNPLGVAKIRVQTIEGDAAREVEQNLNRMEAIIDDVLTLARDGKAVEETEQIDLSMVVNRCWNQVNTAEATLTCADSIMIEADSSRCKQLFENLFRNSIEHGSDTVEITVGSLDSDAGFYVEDDGPGIPPEERKEVFDAGYTTNEQGTGFGLNIVQEIAQAHGWTVEITDGTAGGARFEFYED